MSNGLTIGSRYLSCDEIRELLGEYASRYSATILYYDLGGDPEGVPGPGRHGAAEPACDVTLADLARLTVINAQPESADVPELLRPRSDLFVRVSPIARLEDAEPGSDLYQAMEALYESFRRPNIGRAKRSKLLHMKRPWLFPISDTRVDVVFADAARTAGGYWAAIRQNLIEAQDHLAECARNLSETPEQRRLSRLTPLRLLDIVAWMLGGRESAPDTRQGD